MPDPLLNIDILSTDRSWAGDELYEDPGPCSRCGVLLDEDEMPLLLWNVHGRMWCYHFRCLGLPDPLPMHDAWDFDVIPEGEGERMPDRTPGETAYAAYMAVLSLSFPQAYAALTDLQRRAWDAAAQAVLAMQAQEEDTP